MGEKISALPSATTPLAGTELVAIVQSGTTVSVSAADLAAAYAGTLSVSLGGTGQTSFTSGGVVYASGATTLASGSALTFSGGNLACTGAIRSSSATAGVGYTTGAGSTVTQTTNRTTGVTINAVCGAITLFSAAGSATATTFTVSNSAVAATDNIVLQQKSGTDLYVLLVTAIGAGSFNITFYTTGGTTTEQPVFKFTVVKGVEA